MQPSRAAEVSTCAECAAAGPLSTASTVTEVPRSAGPVLTSRRPVPLTAVLVGINVLVFITMVLKGASVTQPTPEQLLRWGANFGPLTLSGQWWRLFTAMFVHIGIVHLALNMWCLWDLGLLAEYLYGPKTYLALYIMSGLAASIVSLARNPIVVTAGASGAIFGLAGALIATLYLAKLPTPRGALRTSLMSLLVFAGYNLAYGFLKSGIDNGAHIGGLISGLLLGSVLSMDFPRHAPRRSRVRPIVFPAFALVLMAGAVVVRQVHMPVVRLEVAEQMLRKGANAAAMRELNQLVKARPNYAPAWQLLAAAYLAMGQDAPAEAALERAAQLNPQNQSVLAQLGILYVRQKRYEQARKSFQQISELNPKDAQAQINLGVTLDKMGRSEEALASFRKATELNPNLPLAWFNFGLGSMNNKHFDDAVDAFTRTTKLTPKDADAWIWLANAYQAKGMTQEADAAYLTGYKLKTGMRRAPARRQ